MKKTTFPLALGLAILPFGLAGCHHEAASDFNSMSREQQVKAMHGDPVKGAQVAAEMRARYARHGPPAGTDPAKAGTAPPKTP